MTPIRALRLQLGELAAADATFLAPALAGNKIKLVIAAFTPSEDRVLGDFTLASFTGSTPLVAGTGTQAVGVDGVSGEQVITILEPAGGWRWECTVAPASPQTVFGFIMTSNDDLTLIGCGLLPQTVLIARVGDEVQIGNVTLRIVRQPMF